MAQKYRVIVKFSDLQDGRHIYDVGDTFPREGKKLTKKRCAELASDANKRHVPLIEAVEETDEEA